MLPWVREVNLVIGDSLWCWSKTEKSMKSCTALMSESWHKLVMLDFVSENLYFMMLSNTLYFCFWINHSIRRLWVPTMPIFINLMMAKENRTVNSLYWGYPLNVTTPALLVTLYFVMQRRRLHTVILHTLMRILARDSN